MPPVVWLMGKDGMKEGYVLFNYELNRTLFSYMASKI